MGILVYVMFMLSLATPLYEPLSVGDDDTWTVLLLIGGASIGAGILIGRAWSLLAGVMTCIALFVANGGEGLATLILVFGIPFFLVTTGIGLAVARFAPKGMLLPVASAAFVVALVPAALATEERNERASLQHVPRAIEAQLPTEGFLNDLCEPGVIPARYRAQSRREARALAGALRERPDQLVSYLVPYADEPPAREDRTVVELAKEQLRATDDCSDPVIRQLRRQTGRD